MKEEHVFTALETAATGAVPEGNVGGGTGMICYEFKGGIGTASRRLSTENGDYTVGVLVQANFGLRDQLRIAGVPVGREIQEGKLRDYDDDDDGSIIIAVATDAPLLPHQLKRLARRASLGIARTGGTSNNSSGDIFIAFSTGNPGAGRSEELASLQMVANARISPIFQATVQATEEAIVNALVAAETMSGVDGRRVVALPHERLREVLRKYNRLME